MKLSEFINKRLKDLGMKRSNLINDYDIAWSTLSGIDHDKTIGKVTQEKLARALQCSQGDIQACLKEMPTPLRKEAEKQEGKIFIGDKPKSKHDVIAKVMRQRPFTPDEEPAEMFKPEVEVCETDMQTAEEFKQELRWLFIKLASDIQVFDTPMHELTSVFGKAVLDRLAEKGVHDGNS